MGIALLESVILGNKSSVLWSQVATCVCDHRADDLLPTDTHRTTNFAIFKTEDSSREITVLSTVISHESFKSVSISFKGKYPNA